MGKTSKTLSVQTSKKNFSKRKSMKSMGDLVDSIEFLKEGMGHLELEVYTLQYKIYELQAEFREFSNNL